MTVSTIGRRLFLGIALLACASMPAFAQNRVVETIFGTVEVPENVTRIVTTHHANSQPLLDLGIAPVGRGAVDQATTTPEQWALVADVPVVSLEGGELNYELIAQLEPDLILEVDVAAPDRIERLKQIAPVLVTPLRGDDFRFGKGPQLAKVLKREEEWAALEAAYLARLEQISADYDDIAAAHPIGILGVWSYDTPSVWHSDSIVGRILAPAGAVFAAAGEALPHEPGREVVISHENIPDAFADADIIFYNSFADGSPTNGEHERVRELDVFKRLPAAQKGHVFPIGQITVGSYATAHNTLDHYVAALDAVAAE